MLDDEPDLAAQHVAFQLADARQVELVDQLGVNPPLDVFEFGFLVLLRQGGRGALEVSSWHDSVRVAKSYEQNDSIREAEDSSPRTREGVAASESSRRRAERPVGSVVPVVGPRTARLVALTQYMSSAAGSLTYCARAGQRLSQLRTLLARRPIGSSDLPLRASASWPIDCVIAAFGACCISGTPLFRTSTITR